MEHSLSSRQRRICEWMSNELGLPVYAEAFGGATVYLDQRAPGYITFVAHVGRDIMNGLARVVRGDQRQQVQYVNHLNKIENEWDERWGGSGGLSERESASYRKLPHNFCLLLKTLIDEHRKGRARNEETHEVFFLTFFNYDDVSTIPANFIREWKDARKYFQSHAHLRDRPFPGDSENEIVRHFEALESNLFAAASSQYERIRKLDEILEHTNR